MLLTLLSTSGPASADTPPPVEVCDQRLVPNAADPFSYRFRGNRCEGFYTGVLQSANLLVRPVSLAYAIDYGTLQESDQFKLSWEQFSSSPTRIRVVSTSFRSYYQMDAVVEPNRSSFVWVARIPASAGLSLGDLGFLAWDTSTGEDNRVYLPATVEAGDSPSGVDGLEVVLTSELELRSVVLSIARVDETGSPTSYVYGPVPGPLRVVPSTRFRIPLPRLKAGQVYLVEVKFVAPLYGPLVTDFLFYSGTPQ